MKPFEPCGLHKDRLRVDRNNLLELAFVKQWQAENNYDNRFDIGLAGLMWVYCDADDPNIERHVHECPMKRPLGSPTERDKIIAETVIQWLGSGVGFQFVREALKREGYEILNPRCKL